MDLYVKTENNQRYLWFEENASNYELLKSFYPRFYDRILEMQEILKAEGSFIDEIQIAFEIVLNNMFIKYMDEDTVEKFEEFLNIQPLPYQSLDERKEILGFHFRGYGKMSESGIKDAASKYNIIAETYFEEKDTADNFILRIKLYVPAEVEDTNYSDCINILEIRLPAHLKTLYEVIFSDIDTKWAVAMVSVFKTSYEHQTEEASLENLPTWFIDDDDNLLLDDFGNILIEE